MTAWTKFLWLLVPFYMDFCNLISITPLTFIGILMIIGVPLTRSKLIETQLKEKLDGKLDEEG